MDEPLLLPPIAPPAAPVLPEPDLLKWASHSARETWPSLFLSTSEKLGAEDELATEPPAEDEEDDGLDVDESVELLLPDAAGEDEDEDDGLDDDEDDCATASDDSANRTAAAVMLRPLGI